MFKLKLEIIRLRLGLKKFEVKEEFREGMNEAIKKIESITTTASEKFMEGKEKVKSFKGEIQLAYKHFGQALKKLR